MKRHPALEPFSRDHNDGLILARRLSLASSEGEEKRAAVADLFREAWRLELRDHFDEEERLLGGLLTEDSKARLLKEHASITEHEGALEAGDLSHYRMSALGQELHDHIRWEERELFIEIEQTATEEQLQQLARDTHEVEQRRWPNNPKREELVRKRLQSKDFADLAAMPSGSGPLWGTETEDLDATLVAWSAGKGIDLHTNDEVDVIMVVLEGRGIVRRGEDEIAVSSGCVVVIPKGVPREVRAGSERLAYLNVHKRRRRLMPTGIRPR